MSKFELPTKCNDFFYLYPESQRIPEIEEEATKMLEAQSLLKLQKFCGEVESNLKADPSLWQMAEYYKRLVIKGQLLLNAKILKAIYLKFISKNEVLIMDQVRKE